MNSFIISHFSYCPIVWMFHIHERALRIVYEDFKSSFQELLIEDNPLTFITEICKNWWVKSSKLNMAWAHGWCFQRLLRNRTPTRILTRSYFVSTLWNLVPNEYKTIASFVDFKTKIKMCPCRLCKTYFNRIDFI